MASESQPRIAPGFQALTTRIPNLGHVLILLLMTGLSVLLASALLIALSHPHSPARVAADARLGIEANILAYIFTFAAAWFAFAALWNRPFLAGLRWNARGARPWLALLGLGLGIASQAISSFLPQKADEPIDKLFHNAALVVLLPVFGILVAPLFEEMFFRGFLLPALAIAVDWMRVPRSLNALEAWRTSEEFSLSAAVVASVLTSLLFGLIHAWQLGFNWPAVTLLSVVSLVLCWVRLHMRSLAASTLVHACYNASIFIALAIVSHGFRDLDKL
jgi:membrane protease YdiL (CAAX protease family)